VPRASRTANVAAPARALAPALLVLFGVAVLIARSPFRIDHDSALYLDCVRERAARGIEAAP